MLVAVFGLVSLYPSLTEGSSAEYRRAIAGIGVTVVFIALATLVTSAINDGFMEIDASTLYVRFEGFFQAEVPLSAILRVTPIDPRPRWRYRLGLSSDRRGRICCSHGGNLIEIQLAPPQTMRIWPRQMRVSRLWLAVRQSDELLAELRRVAPWSFGDAAEERLAA